MKLIGGQEANLFTSSFKDLVAEGNGLMTFVRPGWRGVFRALTRAFPD
jgi:hypothetical protein